MQVTTALEHWLEEKLRRRWVRIDDAEDRLREELQPFLDDIARAVKRKARAARSSRNHRLSATPAKVRKSVI